MAKDLEAIAKAKKIKYFLVSWVDLFGSLRAKLVPARAIKGMQKDGAGFAGFAAWLDMTPAHPDLFGVPDPDSLIQLPWKPEIAWVAADLWMDGKEVEASPRVALKRQLAKAMKNSSNSSKSPSSDIVKPPKTGIGGKASGKRRKRGGQQTKETKCGGMSGRKS